MPLEPVFILGAACLTLWCAWAWGRMLAATAGVWLEWPLALLVGAGLFSHLVLALGLAGWANRGAFLGLAAATAGGAALVRARGARVMPRQRGLWLLLSPFALVYAVHALAPEISPDGLAYHVALPLRYLREGRVGLAPYNLYAQLSQGMEMLYLFGLSLANRSVTAVIHLGFLVALTALLWSYGRSVAHQAVAAVACVLVFCSPVVGVDAASAYTDVAVAAVLFGLYVLLARWEQERRVAWAVLAGVLAGFGYGLKYTAALGAVAGFVWLMRREARAAGCFAAVTAAMTAPWLLKNWAFTGNPLAPFFNAWFPNAVFDRYLEADYVASLRWYPGLGAVSTLPWEIAGSGFVLNGLLGPVWLLAPLALLGARHKEARRLLVVGTVVALPFATNVGTRFLIPALPFFALALALFLGRWRGLLVGVGLVHVVLAWPWVAGQYAHRYAWRIQEFPWRAALRWESEEAFEGRKLTEHYLARALNAAVKPGERVLTQTQFTDALTHADMVTGALSRPAVEWRRMLYMTSVPRLLPNGRIRFWFMTRPYRAIRLRQNGGAPASIAECRAFRLLTPVRTVAGGGATDGTTLTRVLLGSPLEVRLDGRTEVDRLDCVYHSVPPEPEFVLEGEVEPGKWLVVSDRPELAPHVDQSRELPARAARILYDNGIHYLLLRERDYHRDLGGLTPEKNMAGWPVELVAREYGMYLYRIMPYELRQNHTPP